MAGYYLKKVVWRAISRTCYCNDDLSGL